MGFPQLDFATFPSQIFWLVVTFTLMYIIMSRFALPRVRDVVENRRNIRNGNLRKADELNKKIQMLKDEYKKAVEKARVTATQTVFKAEKEIDDGIMKSQADFSKRSHKKRSPRRK